MSSKPKSVPKGNFNNHDLCLSVIQNYKKYKNGNKFYNPHTSRQLTSKASIMLIVNQCKETLLKSRKQGKSIPSFSHSSSSSKSLISGPSPSIPTANSSPTNTVAKSGKVSNSVKSSPSVKSSSSPPAKSGPVKNTIYQNYDESYKNFKSKFNNNLEELLESESKYLNDFQFLLQLKKFQKYCEKVKGKKEIDFDDYKNIIESTLELFKIFRRFSYPFSIQFYDKNYEKKYIQYLYKKNYNNFYYNHTSVLNLSSNQDILENTLKNKVGNFEITETMKTSIKDKEILYLPFVIIFSDESKNLNKYKYNTSNDLGILKFIIEYYINENIPQDFTIKYDNQLDEKMKKIENNLGKDITNVLMNNRLLINNNTIYLPNYVNPYFHYESETDKYFLSHINVHDFTNYLQKYQTFNLYNYEIRLIGDNYIGNTTSKPVNIALTYLQNEVSSVLPKEIKVRITKILKNFMNDDRKKCDELYLYHGTSGLIHFENKFVLSSFMSLTANINIAIRYANNNAITLHSVSGCIYLIKLKQDSKYINLIDTLHQFILCPGTVIKVNDQININNVKIIICEIEESPNKQYLQNLKEKVEENKIKFNRDVDLKQSDYDFYKIIEKDNEKFIRELINQYNMKVNEYKIHGKSYFSTDLLSMISIPNSYGIFLNNYMGLKYTLHQFLINHIYTMMKFPIVELNLFKYDTNGDIRTTWIYDNEYGTGKDKFKYNVNNLLIDVMTSFWTCYDEKNYIVKYTNEKQYKNVLLVDCGLYSKFLTEKVNFQVGYQPFEYIALLRHIDVKESDLNKIKETYLDNIKNLDLNTIKNRFIALIDNIIDKTKYKEEYEDLKKMIRNIINVIEYRKDFIELNIDNIIEQMKDKITMKGGRMEIEQKDKVKSKSPKSKKDSDMYKLLPLEVLRNMRMDVGETSTMTVKEFKKHEKYIKNDNKK
tara:strand:+ start:1203 stop:4013 length:2811 start_codon:yes stop_codon:yes gene_type:complete